MEAVSLLDPLTRFLKWIYRIFVPPKPKLCFEEIETAHWYDKDDDRSGVSLRMFIINRGNKPTTIRNVDIVKMNPDHLKYRFNIRFRNPFELPIGKDTSYSNTFFFKGAYLKYKIIKLEIEFTHTEGTEVLPVVSTLMEHLEPEF